MKKLKILLFIPVLLFCIPVFSLFLLYKALQKKDIYYILLFINSQQNEKYFKILIHVTNIILWLLIYMYFFNI